MNATAYLLPGGKRLHLNHGPIDLIVGAMGPDAARLAAFERAAGYFESVLQDLVSVLPRLRARALPRDAPIGPPGSIAAAMQAAVMAYPSRFVTPMAAVAGAVADAVLARCSSPDLERAYVNNGGDCALYLGDGQSITLAGGPELTARIVLAYRDGVRGVATSGWRGRSMSLGIADAVTVLARTAAEADVAATLIANEVDLPGHPAIRRTAARVLDPDSDLGDRSVTVGVGGLSDAETAHALTRGARFAKILQQQGLITAAALWLNQTCRTVGPALIHQGALTDA